MAKTLYFSYHINHWLWEVSCMILWICIVVNVPTAPHFEQSCRWSWWFLVFRLLWCYMRFQIPNKCRVPDKRPLFNETILLLKCMILCVCMPSCQSVFVSKGETCKGYHFTHRYLTGLLFWYSEEETYFCKGNAL